MVADDPREVSGRQLENRGFVAVGIEVAGPVKRAFEQAQVAELGRAAVRATDSAWAARTMANESHTGFISLQRASS